MASKLKKAIVSLVAVSAISAFGISASAYRNHGFDFSTGYNSGAWSDPAVKEDNSNTAIVHITAGTVSASTPLYTTVYSAKVQSDRYKVSTTATLTSIDADGTMTYIGIYGQGQNYYLRVETGAHFFTAKGYWNP